MKYEMLGGLGLLGAIIVLLAMPEAERERAAILLAAEETTRSVSVDFFGPQ